MTRPAPAGAVPEKRNVFETLNIYHKSSLKSFNSDMLGVQKIKLKSVLKFLNVQLCYLLSVPRVDTLEGPRGIRMRIRDVRREEERSLNIAHFSGGVVGGGWRNRVACSNA